MRDSEGFSIVEVIIAMFLLMVLSLAVLPLIIGATRTSAVNRSHLSALAAGTTVEKGSDRAREEIAKSRFQEAQSATAAAVANRQLAQTQVGLIKNEQELVQKEIGVQRALANTNNLLGGTTASRAAARDRLAQLMAKEQYGEACPKLEESQRLQPAGGTQMFLALCHEGEGKTATAWTDFNAALSAARRDHRADREKVAREHLSALEPKLTALRHHCEREGTAYDRIAKTLLWTATVDPSDDGFVSAMRDYAALGVEEVHVMHFGAELVEFVEGLGRTVVPELAAL